ncbi:MAG: methyltransferase domain-containing protein [Actinobacteria bacterium]|nr:methyltransferase domain-containing protein [Actinomycetota bacterium]
MKPALLAVLACPECGDDLTLADGATATDGEITSGFLRCAHDHRYPIRHGIPRLLSSGTVASDDGRLETADAFGYEWTHYPVENPYTVDQVLDWILPLTPADFAGKVVLDGGCGTGGFAAYAADFGADLVVGFDLGDAVESARRLRDAHPALEIVQGDILQPPFKPAFDLVYSIGVLQHLPEPRDGFLALARLTRPHGRMFGWVYGHEGNERYGRIVEPIRRLARGFRPRVVKWGLAFPLALVLSPVLWAAYRPQSPAVLRRSVRVYRPYLEWLARAPFSFVHGVIFDQLVAPTTHYVRQDELREWFAAAGLADVVVTQRNGNSWRGLGTRPGDLPAP